MAIALVDSALSEVPIQLGPPARPNGLEDLDVPNLGLQHLSALFLPNCGDRL